MPDRAFQGFPSFESLVEESWGTLRAFLRSRGVDEADLDDLIQETLIKAFRGQSQRDPGSSFIHWLLTIARHTVIDAFRSRQRRRRDSRAVDVTRVVPSPEDCVVNRCTAEEYLSRLPEEDRLLVHLRLFCDLSFEEIADLTDESNGALRVRFHRLLKRFNPGKGEEKIHES